MNQFIDNLYFFKTFWTTLVLELIFNLNKTTYADLYYEYLLQDNLIKLENSIPLNAKLSQNYPNPFNPSTIFNYSIPSSATDGVRGQRSDIELTVHNSLGMMITTLVNEFKSEGNYFVEFDSSNLSSGIYFLFTLS